MKKDIVIIVDMVSTGSYYPERIKKLGVEKVYVLQSMKEYPNSLQMSPNEYVDEIFTSTEECIQAIKEDNVLAVIPGSELGVILAEELANKLRLENSNNIKTSAVRRDKLLMQKKLKESGLRYIKFCLIDSPDSIDKVKEFLEINNSEYFIIKPVDSAGSDSVMRLNKHEVISAINELPWGKKNAIGGTYNNFILQEFINGVEYVVDLVAHKNEFYIASVCKYKKITLNNSDFVYDSLIVMDPKNVMVSALIEYAKKASRALDVKVGPVHMELMMDTNSNDVVMIEAGARMHGGIAPLLFENCYSKGLVEMSVDSYLNRGEFKDVELVENGRISFLSAEEEGIAKELSDSEMNSLRAIEGFKGVKLFYKKGDKVSKTVDLNTCLGIIYFSHTSASVIERSVDCARNIILK